MCLTCLQSLLDFVNLLLIAHGSLVFIVSYTGVDVCKLATFFMPLGGFLMQLETSGAPFPLTVREVCGALGFRQVPRNYGSVLNF